MCIYNYAHSNLFVIERERKLFSFTPKLAPSFVLLILVKGKYIHAVIQLETSKSSLTMYCPRSILTHYHQILPLPFNFSITSFSSLSLLTLMSSYLEQASLLSDLLLQNILTMSPSPDSFPIVDVIPRIEVKK